MQILYEIAKQEHLQLISFQPLSGGSVNNVYKLETISGAFVLKIKDSDSFTSFFDEEAIGLEALAATASFRVPSIISVGRFNTTVYLLLEYIISGTENDLFWEVFALQLAGLHNNSQAQFGWKSNNYIGSLPQYNRFCNTSAEFYITQRLEPQFKLAAKNGFYFKELNLCYKNISSCIPKDEMPSLIHGDLWSGNYMVDLSKHPVLIDPAVCFASSEMDLAMMKLFGSFPTIVFEIYNSANPLLEDWQHRIKLYQLYYLLVHLNMFGASYLNSVQSIVKKYT